MQSAALHHADSDSIRNGETSISPVLDAVTQLGGELKMVLSELSLTYANQPTNQVILYCAFFSLCIFRAFFCRYPLACLFVCISVCLSVLFYALAA